MAADPERQAWNSYFWPGTDVLQNNLGIRDPEALAQVEYQITAGRERGIESVDILPALTDGDSSPVLDRL